MPQFAASEVRKVSKPALCVCQWIHSIFNYQVALAQTSGTPLALLPPVVTPLVRSSPGVLCVPWPHQPRVRALARESGAPTHTAVGALESGDAAMSALDNLCLHHLSHIKLLAAVTVPSPTAILVMKGLLALRGEAPGRCCYTVGREWIKNPKTFVTQLQSFKGLIDLRKMNSNHILAARLIIGVRREAHRGGIVANTLARGGQVSAHAQTRQDEDKGVFADGDVGVGATVGATIEASLQVVRSPEQGSGEQQRVVALLGSYLSHLISYYDLVQQEKEAICYSVAVPKSPSKPRHDPCPRSAAKDASQNSDDVSHKSRQDAPSGGGKGVSGGESVSTGQSASRLEAESKRNTSTSKASTSARQTSLGITRPLSRAKTAPDSQSFTRSGSLTAGAAPRKTTTAPPNTITASQNGATKADTGERPGVQTTYVLPPGASRAGASRGSSAAIPTAPPRPLPLRQQSVGSSVMSTRQKPNQVARTEGRTGCGKMSRRHDKTSRHLDRMSSHQPRATAKRTLAAPHQATGNGGAKTRTRTAVSCLPEQLCAESLGKPLCALGMARCAPPPQPSVSAPHPAHPARSHGGTACVGSVSVDPDHPYECEGTRMAQASHEATPLPSLQVREW